VVIEHGKVAEDGPPKKLEAEGRAFRDIFLDVLSG
jgi:ABC-type multidrug transport system fused ATPase/permease subunit